MIKTYYDPFSTLQHTQQVLEEHRTTSRRQKGIFNMASEKISRGEINLAEKVKPKEDFMERWRPGVVIGFCELPKV